MDTSLYLMMKTERMEEFERTGLLLGAEGLARLGTSTVAVFGVGGVGSTVLRPWPEAEWED